MAEQEEPVRRRVALKVIKLGMDTKQVIARFEAERQALALMDHPNIAKVLDAGATDTGRPYFVMELVRGIKITDYCDQNNLSTPGAAGPLHPGLPRHPARAPEGHHPSRHQALEHPRHLHDGVPVPKVIDFGIAKATEQRLTDKTLFTAFEQFIGTPAYMSPEQAEMSGLDIDTRSDIYAWACCSTNCSPARRRSTPRSCCGRLGRDAADHPGEGAGAALDAAEHDAGRRTDATAKRRQAEPPRLIHLVRGDLDWIRPGKATCKPPWGEGRRKNVE